MSQNKKYHFETMALHQGQAVESDTLSRGVPVHRTTAYLFKDTEHAARLFSLEEPGNIYTRIMNPTQDVLEKRMAALEGGQAALAVASGTSAIFYTLLNLARQGDEIVSSRNLYGGSYTMFDALLPQMGIHTRFVDLHDLSAWEEAINKKTRALYVETIGNPTLEVADLEQISALARKYQLPLVVDSTFSTPCLWRPLEHGADIVVHSLTKWLGGHGTAIGGIVIDGGTFDWSTDKFDLYSQPDSNYHGLRWGHDLGEQQSLAFILRMRTVILRNLGAAVSPDNAWMFLQGLETLPLRMERHSSNALAVARYLEQHEKVAWVRYPGLKKDPGHALAEKYMHNGFGGMVVFGLKQGYEGAVNFINQVQLFSHVANVGDAKSLVLHPASTSHSQMTREDQEAAGLHTDLIRLSVGLEHIDDILEALKEALE